MICFENLRFTNLEYININHYKKYAKENNLITKAEKEFLQEIPEKKFLTASKGLKKKTCPSSHPKFSPGDSKSFLKNLAFCRDGKLCWKNRREFSDSTAAFVESPVRWDHTQVTYEKFKTVTYKHYL